LWKNYLYNIVRKRWYVKAPDGTTLYVAKEDSIILSLLRRFLGPLFGLLRTNFIIVRNGSEDVVGEFNRKFTLLDRYVLDLKADRARELDRRVLYVVAMACEHDFGFVRTAVVYFTSGLTGSLLSGALSPGPSVGASGAIFGVVAAVVVVLYRHQKRFYLRDKRIGFVLLVWAAYQISTGLLNPYIDNYGHLGGF